MAVSLKTAGTWARLVVDGTVTIPGSPAAGDRMFLFATWKTYTVTVTDPNGWTPIGTEFADGTVNAGNGTGSVKVMAWYRDWQSGDTAPTIDWSADPTEGHVVIMLWQKGATETWSTPLTATAAIPADDPFTATASTTVDVPSGAVVMCLIGLRDDSTTLARATTAISDNGSPALTWNGNYVESPATHFNSTTGFDMSGDLGHRFVTTGAAGVTLTTTGDPAAGETGAAKWLVVHALVQTSANAEAATATAAANPDTANIVANLAAATVTGETATGWAAIGPSGLTSATAEALDATADTGGTVTFNAEAAIATAEAIVVGAGLTTTAGYAQGRSA